MSASEGSGPAMRFGLIGCGDIGRLRAAALAAGGSHRLTAVSDVDERRAAEVAVAHNAAHGGDWRALIERSDVDAVIVSTPPSLHAEMCIAALAAGKHVLCEKPLARDPEECGAMVEAAARTGRTLATAFNYRFYPSFFLARELLAGGAIGELSHIRSYGGYSATGHNQAWVHEADVVGGGALHDIGVHLIDLTRSFLGDVSEVTRYASNAVWNYPDCEDNGFLLLRSRAGRIATLHASWTEWGRYRFLIELVGTHGTIRASCFPMRLELLQAEQTGGRVRRRVHRFPGVFIGEHLRSYRWVVTRSFIAEFAAFARAVRGESSLVASGVDGLHAIEIARGIVPTPIANAATSAPAGGGAQRGDVSVSVIQFTSRSHLVRCMEALQTQTGGAPEILVPHDDTLHDVAGLAARFPTVRFLHAPGRRTPAQLRASAASAATGEIMAFLEDHCVPAPEWTARLREAHEQPHAAVGGAVEKGFLPGRRTDTSLNWAVYLADYSRYMNPQPAGAAHSLTDCNVSYKRSALAAIRPSWDSEFHENIVNGLLADQGGTLWLAPDVVVHEQRTLTLRAALRDRFSFGRLFASTRVQGAPLTRRLVFAAAALIMPPVLVARVARNLFGRGRHRLQFVRALPALVLVTATWMLGECVGYLTGTAARALRPAGELRTAPTP